ncbi:hypothetical protein GobsT_28480 [Gemmata obscuriglobus]|uniref:Uncharacterized protein n=1 Tax=Gemmata obscuriglobus TaxID=114 RepID=A0A2Z3H3M0_9BACT|nr:hypothetical protein [Gemmata obscuriglobus]AWM38922.1 hypothetical protein C1280_19305 [Gemmata obscuriglobus]QEG28075.1 hypothetical protein GobsT_28480 [Gemmata obscuriglobus]VTS05680.1 unnamed protein product [Gemmata obscuriglobus UQM 2246]
MTNDAKLGMLVGVVGVVLAAVFLVKPPAQPVSAEPQSQVQPAAVPSVPVSAHVAAQPDASSNAFPSTPVVRNRKDTPVRPVSRQPLADEEP